MLRYIRRNGEFVGHQMPRLLPAHTHSLIWAQELGGIIHSALPAHEASCSVLSPVQPARAGHTPLCDVGSRPRVMWGAGVQSLEQAGPSWGGVRTYLWCHLSCSDK